MTLSFLACSKRCYGSAKRAREAHAKAGFRIRVYHCQVCGAWHVTNQDKGGKVNHKRKKPKSARAGCLLCKPHKANGAKGCAHSQTRQERLSRIRASEQRQEGGW